MFKIIYFCCFLSVFTMQAMDAARNKTDWAGSYEKAVCAGVLITGSEAAFGCVMSKILWLKKVSKKSWSALLFGLV